MRHALRTMLMLALVALAVGCENRTSPPPSPAPPPPSPTTNTAHLNEAHPKLQTLELWVGPHTITAEIARTRQQISTGLMFRKSMKENEGMLFVFNRPHQASFYMKNTYVPLSIAYLDSAGNILEIRHMNPLDESPVTSEYYEVQYVLEMNQGWFKRHQISAGAYLRTSKGSLQETFFGR